MKSEWTSNKCATICHNNKQKRNKNGTMGTSKTNNYDREWNINDNEEEMNEHKIINETNKKTNGK